MATVNTITTYIGGSAANTTYIGWHDQIANNRTYKFTTGSTGATSIAISLDSTSYSGNTNQLRALIDQDSTSYTNYVGSPSGAVTLTLSNGYWNGSLTQNLLPGTVYYLHVFGYTKSGGQWVNAARTTGSVTLTESGAYGASSISSITSSVDTQDNVAIAVSRNSSSFYHKATFSYNGTTLATSNAFATSLTYTCPRSWMTHNTSVTSMTINVSVQTYTSSACTTTVASPVTTTFTLTADSGMVPVLNSAVVISESNTGAVAGLTGYIQGYSKISAVFTKANVDLSNTAGASIASYKLTFAGATVTSTDTASATVTLLSATVTAAGTVTCTVTDTRGRTATYTEDITILSYANPKVAVSTCIRCDSGGVADEDGAYLLLIATGTISSLSGQNTLTLTASDGNNTYTLTSGTQSIVGGSYDPDDSLQITFTSTDALGNTATYSVTIPTRAWAMQFYGQGTGVAFGKAAEYDKTFQIPANWQMYAGGYPMGCRFIDVVGTAAKTSNPYRGSLFTANIGVSLVDGMTVCFHVPVAGNGSYGTLLSLDGGAEYHPIVYNVNSHISTRYGVNSTVVCTYNASQTMTAYYNTASATTFTGVWQVNDYDTTNIYQLRHGSGTLPTADQLGRYRLLFRSLDGNKLVPANTTTTTNATAVRAVNQRVIDPFGEILYYSTTTIVAADANPGAGSLYEQMTLTLGYSFNTTGAALTMTANKPVYIKCSPQASGGAIIDSASPFVQDLPTTNDGYIYIYLGIAYSATAVEMYPHHPVYFHNGTRIAHYA